jgi:hypothetical protein
MACMELELELLNPAEADAALAVVKESFDVCVAPDYSQEGRELFARVVTADYLCSLPHRQGFTLVAKLDGRIVGMCAFRLQRQRVSAAGDLHARRTGSPGGNMTRDAIVDEIRTYRDEIAKEYDYDIAAIFAALRKMETNGQGHHVSLAPRKLADRSPDGSSRAADGPDVAGAPSNRR